MGHARNVQAAFGFLTEGELALLEQLARQLPEEPVIVNIGAGAGTSGLTFFEARPDAILYTVDKQDESHPEGSLEGERNAFGQAGLGHLLGYGWHQIHGDSVEVGNDWDFNGNPVVDLVFIDGWHEYRGCAGDINAWLPRLCNDGIVAIHDYDKAANDPRPYGRAHPYPGVDKAVRELLIKPGYPIIGQVDSLIALRKIVL